MKRTIIPAFLLLAGFLVAPAMGAHIEARVGLGTQLGDFFDASSGFVAGSTSHTNTLCFSDGTAEACFTMTIEGFDSNGAPAALIPNNQAVGIEVGVNDTQIDAGEWVKVTYDAISVTALNPPPSIASWTAGLGSIRLAAFDDGVDTFTYSGPGAGTMVGDDTNYIDLDEPIIMAGDMFTVKADSGRFRMLWISNHADYDVVPEPLGLGLVCVGLFGLVTTRRRQG
jgi:hypothetical protein